MKATVMESKNGKSVILTDDGIFREINGVREVGEVFEYQPPAVRTNRAFTRRITAIAACLVLALGIGMFSYRDMAVYAKVSIGSEPGIEYSLNRKGKVVKVEALTEDYDEAVSELEESGVKGMTLDEAIDMTADITGEHYDPDTDVNVECKDKDEEEKIKEEAEKKIEEKAAEQQFEEEQNGSKEGEQGAEDGQEPSEAGDQADNAGQSGDGAAENQDKADKQGVQEEKKKDDAGKTDQKATDKKATDKKATDNGQSAE